MLELTSVEFPWVVMLNNGCDAGGMLELTSGELLWFGSYDLSTAFVDCIGVELEEMGGNRRDRVGKRAARVGVLVRADCWMS